MIITIVGSMKFKKEMMEKYVDLSLRGYVVLLPVDLRNSKDVIEPTEVKNILSTLHKQKIDLANEILVMNINGYMGQGTYEEIGYAFSRGKHIIFLEPNPIETTKGGISNDN